MKKIVASLVFIISITVAQAQTTLDRNLKIAQDTYDSLVSQIKIQAIENEIVKIETDKFGRITSADSKQEKLKNLLMGILVVPVINEKKEIVAVSSILTIDDNRIKELKIIDFRNDTIGGELYTAVRLSKFINEKKYDDAINLFSLKQRQNIIKLRQEEEVFNYWVSAWTFDYAKLDRYTKRILLGWGNFIYEDNEWKIDEK